MGFGGSGGGGGGSVAGASDVALNNPANNHVLSYDTSTSKWKNSPQSGGSDTAFNYGVRPVIYYSGSAWPARTVPSGYSGAVKWDSAAYTTAPEPPAAINGDRWERFYQP